MPLQPAVPGGLIYLTIRDDQGHPTRWSNHQAAPDGLVVPLRSRFTFAPRAGLLNLWHRRHDTELNGVPARFMQSGVKGQ